MAAILSPAENSPMSGPFPPTSEDDGARRHNPNGTTGQQLPPETGFFIGIGFTTPSRYFGQKCIRLPLSRAGAPVWGPRDLHKSVIEGPKMIKSSYCPSEHLKRYPVSRVCGKVLLTNRDQQSALIADRVFPELDYKWGMAVFLF